eukprot:7224589-Karenia_brevis.AAC.1
MQPSGLRVHVPLPFFLPKYIFRGIYDMCMCIFWAMDRTAARKRISVGGLPGDWLGIPDTVYQWSIREVCEVRLRTHE